MPLLKISIKFLITCASILLFALATFFIIAPDGSEYLKNNPETFALMRNREEYYKSRGEKIRTRIKWIPLEDISPMLVRAIILAEDAKFYSHSGFDIQAIKHAIKENIKRRSYAFGASTITQQLSRNLYLSNEKTLRRKIKEAIIAYKIEKRLPKDRILELYLNTIELGRGIYGVEMASQYYYGKSASDLNLDESTRLAILLPLPWKHSPYDGSRYVERRRKRLLKWLLYSGDITHNEYLSSISTQVALKEDTAGVVASLLDPTDMPLTIYDKLSERTELIIPISIELRSKEISMDSTLYRVR